MSVIEKSKSFIENYKFHKMAGCSFFVFLAFLFLALIDYQIFAKLRIINIVPIKNLFFLNDHIVSTFSVGAVILTLITIGLLGRILYNIIKYKKNFRDFKYELVFLIGTWLIIFIAYTVTMSCCLWSVADVVNFKEIDTVSPFTGTYQILEYNDLCSYTFHKFVDGAEVQSGIALNFFFILSMFGLVLTAILYMISDQLRRLKNKVCQTN